jgi:CBS domain containing-hemolysin-like protein
LHELALEDEWHGAVEVFQRRIVRVDINEPAHAVMRKLRAARLPMAVVRRPSGESAGVVLWDDLVRLLLLPPDQASPVRS